MKKKLSAGEMAGIIIGGIAVVLLLAAGFFATVFTAVRWIMRQDQIGPVNEYSSTKEQLIDAPDDYSQAYMDQEYYEVFEDAIRTDLDYQIDWDVYEYQGEYADKVSMTISYPVITGDIDNLANINTAIQGEIEENEDLAEYIGGYLQEGDTYIFEADTFVTYMDQDVFSVIFMETATGLGWEEAYLISMNVDVRTGMVLNNNDLIDMDEDFAVDFRTRNDKQNGETETITAMSDQEILSYLTDEDYGIAFYTPLGMEIGFNYPNGWLTVTYKDYQKYQKKF